MDNPLTIHGYSFLEFIRGSPGSSLNPLSGHPFHTCGEVQQMFVWRGKEFTWIERTTIIVTARKAWTTWFWWFGAAPFNAYFRNFRKNKTIFHPYPRRARLRNSRVIVFFFLLAETIHKPTNWKHLFLWVLGEVCDLESTQEIIRIAWAEFHRFWSRESSEKSTNEFCP